ncbi:hypothetical protein GA0061098_10636 [Bradyrhizobium shewense]|uniref:Uncharacterized protein n=1 Tax=Bradyrhizobium shewense TaxID=1761772 RepID=A0A1C3XUN7_9BRAD|nr:hypothetical protein GA0061098_10636 [Bradyrhizobium shewense]
MARAKRTTEAPTDPLDAMLARLQLSGIRDQLDNLLDEAARANLSARETLILLCEREIARKDHRRIDQRWWSVIGRADGSRRHGSWTSCVPLRDGIASTRSEHCRWTEHRDRPCRGDGAGPTELPFALH